ncbi:MULTISPECIES: lipid IV(A) 3-deoxy-D-manno-octulosonic acid transferase [Cycloclasticus]|mgnify:CR=1 FL=1|uniref:lipid IV(A) 3-deoxy-D-manno-octulosonic acid transferase n=1 Tax=Cycloclasticus TaxID=34067 RepID=UPI0009109382|nr:MULTISPECIES: lipid IV(A) 3-deoxy-D-manno-octulosonic acid transferase [Cycloclasticus]PHR50356.1 MAG: 3-deoxy-D-manno-octulosonic acid transferase [Cycloclasticus sp.]SHJ18576.1 3-deoxy-D-manno-octulosonic-acid transferase [Cycloclasticus pugetii]|tara:strand:- start:1178 stop:2449 length:1272 start_codon:yes stop_codon:yes gene_type:complete
MRLAYSVLLYLLTPFFILRLLIRGRKAPAYLNRWAERFGWYKKGQPQGVIWFHTVSVGEAEAAFALIDKIAAVYPDKPILVTTTTPTGSARVKAFLGYRVHHVYLPYDLPDAMWRFYRCFKPAIAIILETEIWPNMLHQAQKNAVPSIIVNARLSEKSAKGYAKLGAFMVQTLANITHVCAQTEATLERFVDLGLNKNNISVPGNIKFDLEMSAHLFEEAEVIRRDWFQQRPSWIAASTHEGEDEIVLDAFSQIKKQLPNSLLVLVPRHPERFNTVAKLCEKRGYTVTRRSEQKSSPVKTDVFLLDTLGELKLYYATVDVAFIGGSFVPTGGHNMLEAAAHSVPVLFGPFVHNFTEISECLLKKGAAIQVMGADELALQVVDLLEHPEQRDQMGMKGLRFVEQNKGAVDKVAERIVSMVNASR